MAFTFRNKIRLSVLQSSYNTMNVVFCFCLIKKLKYYTVIKLGIE